MLVIDAIPYVRMFLNDISSHGTWSDNEIIGYLVSADNFVKNYIKDQDKMAFISKIDKTWLINKFGCPLPQLSLTQNIVNGKVETWKADGIDIGFKLIGISNYMPPFGEKKAALQTDINTLDNLLLVFIAAIANIKTSIYYDHFDNKISGENYSEVNAIYVHMSTIKGFLETLLKSDFNIVDQSEAWNELSIVLEMISNYQKSISYFPFISGSKIEQIINIMYLKSDDGTSRKFVIIYPINKRWDKVRDHDEVSLTVSSYPKYYFITGGYLYLEPIPNQEINIMIEATTYFDTQDGFRPDADDYILLSGEYPSALNLVFLKAATYATIKTGSDASHLNSAFAQEWEMFLRTTKKRFQGGIPIRMRKVYDTGDY